MTEPVGIIVPSLNRPQRLRALIENIHATTSVPHRLHFCVSDQESIAILDELGEHYLIDDGKQSMVTRINRLFRETDESIIYGGSDDTIFRDDWLLPMLAAVDKGYHVVAVLDGTSGLTTRRYIDERSGCVDRPNVVLYPGYWHNYSETEFFATAQHRGIFFHCDAAVVDHDHPRKGRAGYDSTYQLSDRYMDADRQLFHARVHLWH